MNETDLETRQFS